jgi:hypothetical protein
MVAICCTIPKEDNPVVLRAQETLRTARVSLADPVKVAKIDKLIESTDLLATITPGDLNKRILDIILNK